MSECSEGFPSSAINSDFCTYFWELFWRRSLQDYKALYEQHAAKSFHHAHTIIFVKHGTITV